MDSAELDVRLRRVRNSTVIVAYFPASRLSHVSSLKLSVLTESMTELSLYWFYRLSYFGNTRERSLPVD